MRAKDVVKEYKKKNVVMWTVPSKSPDLNPIEKFWAYLRKKLRAMDLKDANAGRPVLGKTAYRARIARVVKTMTSQRVAKNIALSFRRACAEVVKKKGAATSH